MRHLGRQFFPGNMQPISGACACKQIKTASNETRPPGLVAGSESCSVVAMEIFVEQDVILPMRIFLKLFGSSINRALAVLVSQENTGRPSSNFLSYLEQSHLPAGAGGAFDFEVVAVELIQVQQSAYEQAIHGHPHRTSPIGVSSEHSGV